MATNGRKNKWADVLNVICTILSAIAAAIAHS